MKLNFFPRTYDFNAAFQRQNSMIQEAASLLHTLFANPLNAGDLVGRIHNCEEEGDKCAREISKRLSLTFITPIDREDIHNLSTVQEDVLDLIKAIATRVGLYQLKKMNKGALELVDNLRSLVDATAKMLSNYIARKDITECLADIRRLKAQSDALLLVILGELYEYDLTGPDVILDIVKWTHIYDRVEQAIVRTGDLADVLEGMALKYA